mgnify:CR=1
MAHRLQTIADCDRIFVINSGKLVEEGEPHELLTTRNKESFFNALVDRSGEGDLIRSIAKAHKLGKKI